MAPQITPRYFIPPAVNHDDITYQWVVDNETRVVSIIRRDEGSVCHVFDRMSSQFTEVPIRLLIWKELFQVKVRITDQGPIFPPEDPMEELVGDAIMKLTRSSPAVSWIKIAPEVVITDQGPTCLLFHESTRLELKTIINIGVTQFKIWIFKKAKFLRITNLTKCKSALIEDKVFIKNHRENPLIHQNKKSRSVSRHSENTVIASIYGMLGGFLLTPFAPMVGVPLCYTSGVGALSSLATAIAVEHYEKKHSPYLASSFVIHPVVSDDGTPVSLGVKLIRLEISYDVREEIQEENIFRVQKWTIEGKKIVIAFRNNLIKFGVIDEQSNRGYQGNLEENAPERQEEEALRIIEERSSQCVYLQKNGAPSFYEVVKRWDLGNNKILGLVAEEETLRWWIFDADHEHGVLKEIRSNLMVKYPLKRIKVPSSLKEYSKRTQFAGSSRCSKSTKQFLYAMGDMSREEQLEAIDSFVIRKIQLLNSQGAKFIKAIMEPKESEFSLSQMDERIKVTKHSWAVTLIRVGGEKRPGGCRQTTAYAAGQVCPAILKYEGQHAEIVIEGIAHEDRTMSYMYINKDRIETRMDINLRKGQPFLLICHFNVPATGKNNNSTCAPGNSVVLIEDFFNRGLEPVEKSQVWKRPRHKVLEMLDRVYKEARREVEIPLLHTWGKYAGVNKKRKEKVDSCITWTFPKLEMMDIHLDPTYIGMLFGKERGITSHTASSSFTYSEKYHKENPPEDIGLL
ncbi:MAG: hypothetical protein COT84_08440 [Chlamydiae bacterium CG10_big_fil_rev_8_21_14_0_10_35_9]|nr:MAG: hypothetical protein COT84_08440 [Chlamydiae bacterium CG10_big_fil_rev_8_21_14_0_10_35_9]